nr:MAG: hypothetical protein DIU81_08085 [[Clostridium] cellulosi]
MAKINNYLNPPKPPILSSKSSKENEIKIDIEEMQVFNQYLRGKINQFETQLSDIWKRIEVKI